MIYKTKTKTITIWMIMYLIKTEWCPYSQKAIQEYEKLKIYYKDKLNLNTILNLKK